MKLQFLLNDASRKMPYKAKKTDLSMDITGITDDTEKVRTGNIFVCIKGAKHDGHSFASDMIANGAFCVVAEHDVGLGDKQIIVKDSRIFYGLLCAAWFHHPEEQLKLVGVTGTNGKTTIASMIAYMLSHCRKKVGLIGTTGVFINGEPIERDNSTPTTPKVFELYEIFSKMVRSGVEYAVMEVTSFALEQCRIGPAVFRIGIFTNLTRDHLDYHKTMDNYYEAKKKLFTEHCLAAIVNTADVYGSKLYSEIKCEKYSYGVGSGYSVYAEKIMPENSYTKFWFMTTGNNPVTYPVTINMVGGYNVLNAVAAIAACTRLGMTLRDAATALSSFKGVRGRCEVIPTNKDFTVVCDYAHTPDALEKMLSGVRENTRGKLICLFGCGGDRDKTKRPLMAKAVEKYADHIIVTSDNPRNENPELIIKDIVAGFSPDTSYDNIPDRKEAIYHGIRNAGKGDVLVLAGKGHEDYQILAGNKHIHFDERKIVAEALDKIYGKVVSKPPVEKKRETLTLDEICHMVKGKPFGAEYNPNIKVYADEINSDTRTVSKGALFIGLKGDKFNGSAFAEMAVRDKGAVCAITDRIVKNTPCITVPDTGRALLDLAGSFRSRFSPVMIAVTGSVGKTTCKEFTAWGLSSKYRTLKSSGNQNNHIGLPFTLLKLNSDIQAAVVEMGMNHAGEIDLLTRTAKPDICIITNIGYSHIENLGSQNGILKAKLEIVNGTKPDSPLIVNGDDPLLSALYPEYKDRKVITCGIDNSDCNFRAVDIVCNEEQSEFDIIKGGLKCGHCVIPAPGKHFIIGALLAAAAADCAGCSISDAAAAMKKFSPPGLRQHTEKINGQKLIIDCYNAAPASVKAAIDVLKNTKTENGGKRVCVLGDMLELGSYSEQLHKEVGKYAAKNGVDLLIAYGKYAKAAASGAESAGGKALSAEKFTTLMDLLRTYLQKGDTILFKGSRAMRLEDAVQELYKSGKNEV